MAAERILIVYNDPVLPPSHPDHSSEIEVLSTVAHLAKILNAGGYRVRSLGVGRDPEILLTAVREDPPDAVFNLFEGLGDQGGTEPALAGLLEWLGIPFTGCPSHTLALARNKPLTKYLLRGAGLPTAKAFVVECLPVPVCPLPWPVIVKPGCTDASIGIDHGSVVTDQARLEQRVLRLLSRFGPPVLVEQFLPGREFQVAIIDAPHSRALPPSEYSFPEDPTGQRWPILTYKAKWDYQSEDFDRSFFSSKPDIHNDLRDALQRLALRAYAVLGMRDYGRVDFRVLPSGECFVLEANPNPDLHPEACISYGIHALGLTYGEMVWGFVRNALARRRVTGVAG